MTGEEGGGRNEVPKSTWLFKL